MAIITLILASVIALQLPAVQTAAVNHLVSTLSKNFDCDIHAAKVTLEPFNTLIVQDIVLLDTDPYHGDIDVPQDTVFSADRVAARFTLGGLLSKNGIKLIRAEIEKGRLALVMEPNEYKLNLSRVLKMKHKDEKKDSDKEILSIGRVKVTDFTYRMINYNTHSKQDFDGGINWYDMDVKASIEGRKLSIKGSSTVISGIIDKGVLSEKSGFQAYEVSGKARGGGGLTHVENLHIRDMWSDINLSDFQMIYEDSHSFSDFINQVRLKGEVEESRIAFSTITYFAPALKGNPVVAEIHSGSFDGPVADLTVQNFNFNDLNSGVKGQADVRISGIPAIRDMALDCNVESLHFSTGGLSKFISSWARGLDLDLGKFAGSESFNFKGTARGPISHLDVIGDINSSAGDADADICIKNLLTDADISIHGKFGTDDIDVGKFINKDFIHECSLRTGMEATLGKDGIHLKVDSLTVDRLNLLGYDYSGIKAAGTFSERAFNGRIVCNDPNVNFMFQGLFNLSRRTNNAEYRFFAYLGYADLHALKIDNREISRVSLGSLNGNFRRITKGELVGTIDATDLILESSTGRHKIGDMHINSSSAGDHNSISLSSAFADGQYSGAVPFISFVRGLQDITLKRELTSLYEGKAKSWSGDRCDVRLDFHDSRDLLSFIYPGAYVADSTALRVRVDANGSLRGSVRSPRIALREKYIKGLDVQLNNNDQALNCSITSDEISISKQIKLKNDALLLYANDNNVGLGFNYNNMTATESRGEIYLTGDLSDSRPGAISLNAKSLTSNIYYNGEQWRFNPAEYTFADKQFKIGGLSIQNGDQQVSIEGGVSPVSSDTLNVTLDNINLSILNSFLSQNMDIAGITSGKVLLASPTADNLDVLINLVSTETSISGHDAGTIRIGSNWDDTEGKLHIALRNEIGSEPGFEARGFFAPSDKTVSLTADMKSFDLGYAESFLKSVFDDFGGMLSGRVSVEGPLDNIDIRSEGLRLKDGYLKVGYTQVPYHVNGALSLDNSGVHFNDMDVRDNGRGTGVLSGGISFDHFKNIKMATNIRLENIECLNTRITDNDTFYGHVYGTGRMNITGPFNSLLLDIDATTVRDGSFHLPLGGSGSLSSGKLLTFKEPERIVHIDPYEQMMNSLLVEETGGSDMAVKLRVNAQQGVEACLDMSGSAEIAMRARGSGVISLDVRPSKDIFTINGDYTLNSGNCRVSAFGIANKEFSVREGSSIKFNGDIMDSDLDLDALYQVKTSLSNLIADTTSVSTRRNVECGIKISDKLSNPKLDFSINVPDLDPMTKSSVESALSTDDKIQKQFIALLVTNNFLPDEQSGVVNNSNILYSNVADIMANQLNSILQKLDIPLDLGLNYQSSDSGTSIFDVALSTQLFNNRVIVNGNIGNRQYMSSTDESVVGDLDIEIKMDKSGQVRLNLFSHSADQYTNYLDNSQRNGVGVTYQKEFNSLKDFLKGLFTPKSKKQEMEQNQAEVEKITINIE